MEIQIEKVGAGGVKDQPDIRDFVADPILGTPVIDWTKPFILTEPPDENQWSSVSCVAQSVSYLHWQIGRKNYSRRDVYNKIYLPQGGAYIRDGILRIPKFGQATRDELFDPNPQFENEMRLPGGTVDQEISDRVLDGFVITTQSIDTVAAAIEQYQGVVFGLYLSSNYGNDPTNLNPPPVANNLGHALYLMGHHLHDNAIKCVIAKSSWCGLFNKLTRNIIWPLPANWEAMVATGNYEYHHEHHIRENYFSSGMTFNPWTLIPRKDKIMIEFVKNQSKPGEFGLLVESAVGTQYVPASTEIDLKQRAQGLDIFKPDGSVDYSKARIITL